MTASFARPEPLWNSIGGVVVCGGQSRRMGTAKAWLPLAGEALLQRVVGQLIRVCRPVVVVAAQDQLLPALPPSVEVQRDQRNSAGPLEAIRVGLLAVQSHCEAAFVASCDLPFLDASFVSLLCDQLGDHDIAVPVVGERLHVLSAVYRTRLAATAEGLLIAHDHRVHKLLSLVHTRYVRAMEMQLSEMELEKRLMNLNEMSDYQQAIALLQRTCDGES